MADIPRSVPIIFQCPEPLYDELKLIAFSCSKTVPDIVRAFVCAQFSSFHFIGESLELFDD